MAFAWVLEQLGQNIQLRYCNRHSKPPLFRLSVKAGEQGLYS